jgi:hypothetical protein
MRMFNLIDFESDPDQVWAWADLEFTFDAQVVLQLAASIRFVQKCSQALAIQGPGMVASNWPDWVILPYIIGAELTVE